MTTAVYVSAKETYERIYRALQSLSHLRVSLQGAYDDEIIVDTGMRGREIRLKMYQGSSFSIKLVGLNLVRCRQAPGASLWLRQDEKLSRTEVQWHIPDRDVDRFVEDVANAIRYEAVPLFYGTLGSFVMCHDCPYQLECVARS